ncbi:MAG: hypothetical protein ACT4PV_16230 [Planctomycetaceae bacterium]
MPRILAEGASGRMAPARLLALLLAAAAAAPAGEGLESRVDLAIDRAAVHVDSRRAAGGSRLKEDAVHPKGRTALCAYALRHAGRGEDHPSIVAALSLLEASGPIEAISTCEADRLERQEAKPSGALLREVS